MMINFRPTIIKVKKPSDDNLGASFLVLLDFIKQTKPVGNGDRITIDMSAVNFSFPLLILPISGLNKLLRQRGIQVDFTPMPKNNEYLNAIKFPFDLSSNPVNSWNDSLAQYRSKTYLPICSIPTRNDEMRENILTTFGKILVNQLNISGQLHSAIIYIISEIFDNIVEHADVAEGWIMAQNYPNKQFLDVCILDTGIGVLGSYKKAGIHEITSDEKALQVAINGLSTKSMEETRGFGITTSRKMLVRGLKGKFLLFSGSAFYISTYEQEDTITALDESYRWEGTVALLRIPKKIPEGFNYWNFVE